MAEQFYTVASDSETTGNDKAQSSFANVAIGIDIGTSKCSVAVWNGARVELLRNTRNQKLMRSYVMFKDDTPSGGVSQELGHDEGEIFSGSAIFNMKRLIGRMDTDPVVHASKSLPFLVQTLDIGARPFIAALVNNIWRSTTPEEQTRIERASAIAGLHVLRLMPEPTSVALLYAQQQQKYLNENMGSGCEKVALIFNMGAGYTDVAITATAGGVSQIKASSGCTLGGEDVLQNVMRHLLPNFDSFCDDRSVEKIKPMGLLRITTQDAIHRLSSQPSVHINVDVGSGVKISRTLDRSEFEQINRIAFEQCERLIKQCLHDAKLIAEDIDDVVLVGGCSNIPKVQDLVLGLCKKEDSYKDIEPLEAAVYGAALEGAIALGITDPSGSLDLLTIQATPLSLGIHVNGDSIATIIHRNTAIPVRKDMLFTTAHDNQTEALIVVYEGEAKSAKENSLLGYFKITGIPPAPKGTAEINVCMDIDASNVLRVLAGVVVAGSQQAVSPFIEVRMPTLDEGQSWCGQALTEMYGATLGLATIPKKPQQ
ncbi:heat shock 70 kDa protein 8 isoform X4 [Typha latifolia]